MGSARVLSDVKTVDSSGAEGHATLPLLVSVMAPMLDEAEHVDVLVADLAAQDYGGETEFLFADGGSRDGSVDLLQAAAARSGLRVTVLHNPAGMVSSALNICVEAAHGDPIVRIDCHSRYPADYLRRCVLASTETRADNVGGVFVPTGWTPAERAVACAMTSAFGGVHWTRHGNAERVDVDTVPYGTFRAEVFRRVGRFDESLVRNQDDEFNLRLRLAGGRVVQDSSIRILYRPRSSLRAVFRQYFEYGLWKPAVMRKHRRATSLRSLAPVGLVGTLVTFGALAPWSAWALRALVVELAVYSSAALVFGAVAVSRSDESWRLLPRVVGSFGAFHLGHGLGFVVGLARELPVSRRLRDAKPG